MAIAGKQLVNLMLRNSSKCVVCYYTTKTAQTPNVLTFVPKSQEASDEDITKLQEFISNSNRLFIVTGAGISTESGIPDYRSEGVGLYATSKNRPVQYCGAGGSDHGYRPLVVM